MKTGRFISWSVLFGIAAEAALSSISTAPIKKVALIGTTGQLGREAVCQLSAAGIAVKCLLRHDISTIADSPPISLDQATTPTQVAAYLWTLPLVEFVQGDINNEKALKQLVSDADACLALHGAQPPKPFLRSLIFPALFYPETDPSHPKQVNYVGIQRLLAAMDESDRCKHLVRITGKGETPWSFFSILINAFGGMAKAWNYEAEQLIRNHPSNIDYTIIRPGIMKPTTTTQTTSNINNNNNISDVKEETSRSSLASLGLRDNGGDLPVTVVSYGQIAALAIDCLQRSNMKRSTLSTMNMDSIDPTTTTTTTVVVQTADQVRPDTRVFPTSLLAEHRRAARTGGLVILTLAAGIVAWILSLLNMVFG